MFIEEYKVLKEKGLLVRSDLIKPGQWHVEYKKYNSHGEVQNVTSELNVGPVMAKKKELEDQLAGVQLVIDDFRMDTTAKEVESKAGFLKTAWNFLSKKL